MLSIAMTGEPVSKLQLGVCIHLLNKILPHIRCYGLPLQAWHKDVFSSIGGRIGEVVGVDYRVRSRIRNMAKCYKKGYAPIFVAMEVEMLGIIFQM